MKTNRMSIYALVRRFACAMALLYAGDAWGGSTAPINPKFMEWQRKRECKTSEQLVAQTNDSSRLSRKRLLAASGENEAAPYVLGYVPDLVDYSYLKDINFQGVNRAGVLAAEALPSSFDLRTANRITSIKNQGRFGTCWAHATFASLESCLLSQGEGVFDFSEKHLAATHGRDLRYSDGGNATIAAAYLTRWSGPIAENEDPYPTESWTASPKGTPLGHIQNFRILTPMSTGYDTEEIKRTVYEVGAVYASYTHVDAALSNDGKNFFWNGDLALYNPNYDGGHAVTIIGWDDNYSKNNFKHTPPYNGAFLVKNSWGANSGDKGCFWVSYWDATFGGSELCCFDSLEPIDNYGDIYQYDPLGKVGSYGGKAIMYGANVFVARKDDVLAAVGFYANAPNTKYTISIYVGCTATTPISNTLVLTQSGAVENCGFATIPLDKNVSITKGQRFSIVFRLNTPGYNYPLAFEAYFSYNSNGKTYWTPTSEATASSGESFFSTDGNIWTDFTKAYPNGNLCFKAYTKSTTVTKPELASIAISGVASLTSGQSAQFTCEATYSDRSKKAVSPTWSIARAGQAYATVSASGLVTAKEVSDQRMVTIQATYKEDDITLNATYGMFVTVAAPSAPTGVSATQGTEASCVRVNWTAPNGATEYAVYRATANNSKNAQYLEKVTVARYSDTTAVPGVDYWYFIKAKNSSGASGYSIGANGWRKLAPPESVVASDTLLDKVALEWSEVEGAKCYRAYRAESIDGEKTALGDWQTATTFDDTTATAGATYYYYIVAAVDANGNRPSDCSIVEDGTRAEPVRAASIGINGAANIASGDNATYAAIVKYTDGTSRSVMPKWSLTSGSAYASLSGATVIAKTVAANQSATIRAVYTEDGITVTADKAIAITAVVPVAPTGLTLVSQASSGIEFVWNQVAGASSYKIYRATGSGAAYPIGTAMETRFVDQTAMPGVACIYSVAAINGAGESARSAALSGIVPLSAPAGVTATNDRTNGVFVAWQAVNGASYYLVSRATSATGAKTALGSWKTGTSYLDSSARTGTRYWYFVRAATSSGGANASGYSASAQGVRKVPVMLSDISISGPDKVPGAQTAMYSCTAIYSNGATKLVSPAWTVSGAATIDANGRLTANAVSANSTATVSASFTDGTTKTAEKTVTVIAPARATAEIRNINITSRWPFSSLLDIDYELVTDPMNAKAAVSVFGHDKDHGVDMAAKTLSGDGSDGSHIAAGAHRLTWDIGADYPGFHATSFNVTMTAAPLATGVPTNVTITASTSGVTLNWNAVENADGYEVWRGTGTTTNGATRIATVTDATTYFDGTGAAGTTYRYWLRALGDDGIGEFAQSVTGMRIVIVPASLAISGAPSVTAGESSAYTCRVSRNDGTGGQVTPAWSITSGSSYASIDSSGVLTASGTTTQRSVTIKASYTQNGATVAATKTVTIATKQVAISFNGNGGAVSPSSQTHTAYDTYGSLPTPTRTGYTFAGWWTESSGGTEVISTSIVPASDTTLHARWTANTCTIFFHANGGAGNMENIVTTYDVATNLPDNGFTREYYTFQGWATTPGGNVAYHDGESVKNLSATAGGFIDLYAKWAIAVPIGLSINGVDSVEAGAIVKYFTSTVTFDNGDAMEVPADWSVTNTAYARLSVSGTKCQLRAERIDVDAYVDLFASYTYNDMTIETAKRIDIKKVSQTVSFDANGGTLDASSKTFVRYGTYGELPIPAHSTEFGFAGWFTEKESGKEITKTSVVDSSVTTLYAHWVNINWTITDNGELTQLGWAGGKVKAVGIPSNVKKIGNWMFQNKGDLEAVLIPDSVTSIGDGAFRNCLHLERITIPNSVTNIGSQAFEYCSSLANDIVLPSNLTAIGDSTFSGCSSLTNISIPNTVTRIGNSAFSGCSNLINISIPSSVTHIGDSAFRGCSGFAGALAFPGTLESVGARAFLNCSGLTSVSIPRNVAYIGEGAFGNCIDLLTISVNSSNPNYTVYNGMLFNKTKTALLWCPVSATGKTIPASVTKIGNCAFYGCGNLATISLPASVTAIGDEAFGYCHKLAGTLTIPDTVTMLGERAFIGCSNLVNVTLPKNLEKIKRLTFNSCTSLKTIAIPDNVKYIYRDAFANCKAMESVALGIGVTRIGYDTSYITGNATGNVFEGCDALREVHIKDLSAWCKIDFENAKCNPLCNGASLYLNGSMVKNLVVPNDVTSIGFAAFFGCSGLASVTIPDTVTSIGKSAFNKCGSLTSVTIRGCLKSYDISYLYYSTPETLTTYVTSAWTGPTDTWCDRAVIVR